jgi:hypothetical protein
MVKAIPVLSLTIFVVTNDEGVLVGKGPAVSEAVTVQFPDVVVPEVTPAVTSSSLLHELIIGIAKDPNPTNPNPFKKSFLSMIKTVFSVTDNKSI